MYIVVKGKKVTRCRDCPYFGISMDGAECNHPEMKKLMKKEKDPYLNLIDVNSSLFPEECPEKYQLIQKP